MSHQIDFPVVYTNAKAGTATRDLSVPGSDLTPLLDLLVEVTPPPMHEPGTRCSCWSPTSAPTTTSDAWRWAASTTAPSASASA